MPYTASFDPATGPVGQLVNVTGAEWSTPQTFEVTLSGTSAPNTLSVDGSGNLTGTITVPQKVSGRYDWRITGSTDGEKVFNGAFQLIPSATFLPVITAPGLKVAVTGNGYAANESISGFSVDGQPGVTHTLVVDGDGVISGDITIPASAADASTVVITGSGGHTFTNALTCGVAQNSLNKNYLT